MGMIQGYLRISQKVLDQLKTVDSIEENLNILKQAEDSMDIGKTWQFMTYLLTGDKHGHKHFISNLFCPEKSTIAISDEEYDYVYFGEDTKKIEDIEKRMAINNLYLEVGEVEKIVQYLQKISITELFNKCDFEEVRRLRIYGDWDISEGHRDYITENFNNLLHFLESALNNRNYVVVEVPGT